MPKASYPQPGQLALFEEVATQESVASEPAQHAVAGDEAGVAIQAGEPDVPEPRSYRRSATPARGGPRYPVTPRALPSPSVTPRALPSPSVTPRVPPSPSVTLDEVIPDYLAALAALGRSQHT